VFLFHGMPGSRMTGALGHEAAARNGVRLVCPDRPGYGLSDHKLRRTILDWTDDVTELADALGFERFAVAGISGGGPYTAACALRLSGRLIAAAILSGVSEFDVPGATEDVAHEPNAVRPSRQRHGSRARPWRSCRSWRRSPSARSSR
jgi:pimeloyl-ACP methyl ester carboxylesterase